MIRTKTCLFNPAQYERFYIKEQKHKKKTFFQVVGVKKDKIEMMINELGDYALRNPHIVLEDNLETIEDAYKIMDKIENY